MLLTRKKKMCILLQQFLLSIQNTWNVATKIDIFINASISYKGEEVKVADLESVISLQLLIVRHFLYYFHVKVW